jgi:oligosaccharide repeat unit polymerase
MDITAVAKLIVVLLGAIVSLFLFYRASSTLNITKINIVLYVCILFFLQTYIGASMAYLGDVNHYTFKYLVDAGNVNVMYYCVLLTAVLLPGSMVLFNKILRVDIGAGYRGYLKKPVDLTAEKAAFVLVAALSVVCLSLLAALLYKIGFIPLLRLINPPEGYNFAVERIKISGVYIISSYIKNTMVLSCIPLLSYVSFAFAFSTKKARWVVLTCLLVAASIIVKTYNFEKSPIMYYGFVFLFVYLFVRGRLSKKFLASMLVLASAGMIFFYRRMDYIFSFSDIDIYNGPIGRILFTQVGTLTYHFDLFPQVFPFLDGRSLPRFLLAIIDPGATQLRSARLVMDFYGSQHVYQGTGGVMNTFFIGEAYANFGFLGMALGIIYVGVLIALVYWLFLKIGKNPLYIALFAVLTGKIATTTQGGFVDFIYNADTIFTILVIVAIRFASVFLDKSRIFNKKPPAQGYDQGEAAAGPD